MKNYVYFLLVMTLLFVCCSTDEESINPVLGKIDGSIYQMNEYGLYAADAAEPSVVYLMSAEQEMIQQQQTAISRFSQSQAFSFDSLAMGTYFLVAEAPSFSTCKTFEITVSEANPIRNETISLKSHLFSASLNAFQIDSLIDEKLYHSFDVEKENGQTLGLRLYISDTSDVSNKNYKESLYNLSIRDSERSGQYYKYVSIDLTLYKRDSIYVSAYLVNPEADECVSHNGLVLHFPYAPDYITTGIEL
ncbi:MAG: hypothetical protein AAF847_09195 [Bacteroidota bacterium]